MGGRRGKVRGRTGNDGRGGKDRRSRERDTNNCRRDINDDEKGEDKNEGGVIRYAAQEIGNRQHRKSEIDSPYESRVLLWVRLLWDKDRTE